MTYNPDTAQGISATSLADAGTLTLTDIDVINRAGIDYRSTMSQRITLFRKTPAGSRSAALPATLTAADHDKNVVLTGTTGNLTVDGTVADGFRCHVINNASGAASYSGIIGLLSTTSLASGGVCTVMTAGTSTYASASSVTAPSASAYTASLAAASGNVGSPVTITLTPTGGSWPGGQSITLSATGVAGAFSTNPLTPPSSSAPVTSSFTPSAAGTATISFTASPAMTNTTGNLTYTANMAVATSYAMVASTTSGLVGSPVTLTFTPTGGVWPASITITPAATVAGAFSTLSISTGTTSAATCTFTPSAAGNATISATNNASLSNPASLTYAAVQAATAYTTAASASSGTTGAGVTLTFTPTGGGWPAGRTITPAVSGVAGTFSPATISPAAGGTSAVTCVFTPTATGTATLTSSVSPAMTNSTGNLTYTVTAAPATAYATTLSASSGVSGSPVTITFTPSGGAWPTGVTITPTATSLTGSFSPVSISPSGGSTTPVSCTFTPGAGGSGSISSSTSPAMTNSTGPQPYTVTGVAPSYPTITTAGATRAAIFDANAGVTQSGGIVSALADQSGNGNNLTATVGVNVGGAVNGFPSITFGSATNANNPGLRSTAAWVSGLNAGFTFVLAFKTGATLPTGTNAILWHVEQNTYTATDDMFLFLNINGTLSFVRRRSGQNDSQIVLAYNAIVPNTLYKVVVRYAPSGGGYATPEAWLNAGARLVASGLQNTLGAAPGVLSIGQAATTSFNYPGFTGNSGFLPGQFLEAHLITGGLSDADVATHQNYLTSKWGS